MTCTEFMHMHRDTSLSQPPGSTSMIQMDMCEKECFQILRFDTKRLKP